MADNVRRVTMRIPADVEEQAEAVRGDETGTTGLYLQLIKDGIRWRSEGTRDAQRMEAIAASAEVLDEARQAQIESLEETIDYLQAQLDRRADELEHAQALVDQAQQLQMKQMLDAQAKEKPRLRDRIRKHLPGGSKDEEE